MKQFSNILCVLSIENLTSVALARAVSVADSNQANLTVAVITQDLARGDIVDVDSLPGGIRPLMVEARDRALEHLLAPYRESISSQLEIHLDKPYLEVIRQVLRNGHDLVIKDAEDPDWLDRLLGSEDMHLLRKCPCAVWLVKPGRAVQPYQRILAAVDVADDGPKDKLLTQREMNRQIIEMAFNLAIADSAEVHIVNAWEAVAEGVLRGPFVNVSEAQIVAYVEQARQSHSAGLAQLLREVSAHFGKDALDYIRPQTHLIKGWGGKEIPRFAQQLGADLIVMGTVARTGIPGLIMGNTAESILSQINCSVLAIKPPGFESPVTLDG